MFRVGAHTLHCDHIIKISDVHTCTSFLQWLKLSVLPALKYIMNFCKATKLLNELIIVWYINDLLKLFFLRTSGMHSIIKAQFLSSEGYTRNNGVLQ